MSLVKADFDDAQVILQDHTTVPARRFGLESRGGSEQKRKQVMNQATQHEAHCNGDAGVAAHYCAARLNVTD